jgi:elongation factor Ts
MAEISTQMVKELREATNAGILDCRKALSEANGNFEQAVEVLRKKGLASAAKKASRETNEGIIGHYIHTGSKLASLVELNCETDFVARTESFQEFARDLAMHIAAARPSYLRREDVPATVIDHEKEIYREQMANSGKPAHVLEKIIEGKLDKWYSEVCLLEQGFIKDPDTSIQQLLTQKIATLGENIKINRFARMAIGE